MYRQRPKEGGGLLLGGQRHGNPGHDAFGSKEAPLRICFVIEYYPPHIGGGEVLFQALAEGLVKAGHQCDVITCLLPNTKRHENKRGVNIYRVPVPLFADRYWFTLLALPLTCRIARQADVIHTMTYNGAFPAWLAGRILKKPVVILVHEVLGKKWFQLDFHPLSALFCKLLENLVLCLPFNAYSCNSHNTMRSLVNWGIPAKKLFLAYPGIDAGLFGHHGDDKANNIRKKLGIQDATFVYMYFGRPGMVKGIEYLVRSVPFVRKAIPGSRFVLVLAKKPATKYAEILGLIRQLAAKDTIVLEPVPRKDLPHYIRAADCVVVPSLNEGFGFTCVEACTMGKPVVATNVGSLPEVIFGRYVLVAPADSRALANGIIQVFEKRYDTSPRKKYSWKEAVQRHLEAYSTITARDNKSVG